MKSCIYQGTIGHLRRGPATNRFRYALFMLYLDLDELPTLFERFWLWSARRTAVARFHREHHYGSADTGLKQSIQDLLQQQTGQVCSGPIRLLTHLSYFGYCFNPLSVYYCFDTAEKLQHIVLEVSNTPWGEQHCYVLSAQNRTSAKHHRYQFAKDFHVSPFLPPDMEYVCRLTEPGEQLFVALDNHRAGQRVFSSQLALQQRPINHRNMAIALLRDPLMTLRVAALIHWQAARLWLKKAKYYPHTGGDKIHEISKEQLAEQPLVDKNLPDNKQRYRASAQ